MNTLARLALGLLFLGADIGSVWAQVTGAQVSENLIQNTIYVNATLIQAADSNPGTATLPFKTVGAATTIAVANNKRNIGTKILIAPGTYRESIKVIFTSQATAAPIVFEGQTKGQVIISGSDVWTGWTRQSTTDVYTHPWSYKWGLTPIPSAWGGQNVPPIVRRREMIFVNGQALTQVLTQTEMNTTAGTFYVDETQSLIFLHVTSSTDMSVAKVEVAFRSRLFDINLAKNIVVRNLNFQHTNSEIGEFAVSFADSSDVLIDGCEFRRNNANGLHIWNLQNVTLRGNIASYNGATGMTPVRMKNVLFEDNETSYNNWRGNQGGFNFWAFSGIKSLMIHDAVYRRHRSIGNYTSGLWFDTDCANIVIENSLSRDNKFEGLVLEANQGPITVKNCVFCKNQKLAGVRAMVSRNVTLEGNIFYDNREQIRIDSWTLERVVKNWETGQSITVKVDGWTLKNNAIIGTSTNWILFDTPSWQHFFGSLTSTANLWYNPAKPNVWFVDGHTADLAKWRTLTNQDSDSVFADPRFSDPSNCNFALLASSPLIGKQLPTPPTTPGTGTLLVE
jgi:prepilin-type processing-associated H-X9-DG protein